MSKIQEKHVAIATLLLLLCLPAIILKSRKDDLLSSAKSSFFRSAVPSRTEIISFRMSLDVIYISCPEIFRTWIFC